VSQNPERWRGRRRAAAAALALSLPLVCVPPAPASPELQAEPHPPARFTEWPSYGGDPGGQRYSPVGLITRENVSSLRLAWSHRTGDVSDGRGDIPSTTAFEATPLLVDDTLYVCTPFNRVIALNPETGAVRWSFDPYIDLSGRYANQLVCRGVATWLDPRKMYDKPCRRRIFTATNDARLFALDALSGRACGDFGAAGVLDLNEGPGPQRWKGEYQVTSPPAIIGDLVVVGSAVGDNSRVDAPSGVVRAYDVRSGELRWSQDLAPPGHPRPASGYVRGTPNVWAVMSVDEERDLIFVPTGNPAPDYYGSSVVALRGSTGEVVWHFQTVHHDLWDFDVPAQPTLATLEHGGERVPAVIQVTKMGLLFALHRETGAPLFPVIERPVPQNGAPGQTLSPTQPFPVKPPPLVPSSLAPDDAWGLTPWDRGSCRRRLEGLRFDGIYTPPSLEPTLMYPGNSGGANWGGIAFDPERQLAIVNVMDVPWVVQLVPREDYARERDANPGVEFGPQDGTPYGVRRQMLLSPLGVPCNPPPWGSLVAVDMRSGEIRWEVPFGTLRDLMPIPLPITIGVPSLGGPIATASGVIFIAAAMDNYLRAFDVETGEELWRARLPAGGQATPMTYRSRDGRQFIVVAAGGHGRGGTKLGDHIVAFALPE
jgi:quinoprotein glucose dehydrogenase